MKFATELLHEMPPDKLTGSTTTPIYQTAAYHHETAEEMEKIFLGRKPRFVYTRVNNPTIAHFERRMAALEHGIGAIAFSSGMAAISASIMNILQVGDEIIASGGLFGGTYQFFNEMASFGIKVKYADENNFADLITENSKIIYVETIANPKLDVVDVKKVAELAHKHNLLLFVDNTLTTPYMIRPLYLGADVVIHSTTKMINGGGNAVGGMVIIGKNLINYEKYPKLAEYEKYGNFAYIVRLREKILTNFGSSAAPFNVFLTEIGLDTLSLRMDRACENALEVAKLLSEQKNIEVNYIGLEGNKYYELAKKQFNGKYGTMMTLKFENKAKAFKFINSLKLALKESNIGDVRTLVIHPASTIYVHASDDEKAQAGVSEGVVRINFGIEDAEDLKMDFLTALKEI